MLSIIIPLYNEEENILQVLDKLGKIEFPSFITKHEVIIVDDCSDDGSVGAVKRVSPENDTVRLIEQSRNRGKGAAVKRGFQEAKGDLLLIQDADLELDPDDIPFLLTAMHEPDIQFVNGSRYLPGPVRPLSSYRRYLANRIFTFLTSLLVNVKLTDMACGYKLIDKKLLDRITLRENRFGFEAELIIKALRHRKNNIAEVPVRYFPRNAGEGKKFRNFDAVKILWTIFKYGFLRIN
ncbi:MAG: glycosyltransferase family 2 protein [Bacteroidales bacterium]